MLKICRTFFQSLNDEKIRYCHWKSNTHLEKSLAGKTDLDILVHPVDKAAFIRVLEKLNMKKIVSPPEKRFSGMEDYLGFDYDSAELIHLHLHYKLILGQKYIKNHHLPLEEVVFNNLTTRKIISIPCPEMELILLIIRAHMKADILAMIKHGIKNCLGDQYTAFPYDIEEEFHDLISKSNIETLKVILRQCHLPISEKVFIDFIAKFSRKQLRCYNIARIKYEILTRLKEFRRDKRFSANLRYFYSFLSNSFLLSRFFVAKKKTISGRGKMVSIVGADGSGKSTLVAEVRKWLSWKLEVAQYYYGIPKTLRIKLYSYTIRGLEKFRLQTLASLVENLLWLYIARKRYAISVLSQKDVQDGKLVITDRFPLIEFHDMPEPMDSPRISKCVSRPICRFAEIEEDYYSKIASPDKVIVLQVSIEELRQRKTDIDWVTHKVKADAVNAIQGGEYIVLIDANRPYNDIVLEVKRHIWSVI